MRPCCRGRSRGDKARVRAERIGGRCTVTVIELAG
jgi:hypothetical protein